MTEMTNDSMGKHTGIGEVQIANEVVASIAGISASEVEGVDSMINMKYGYSIPKTCKQVQEKVMQAINSMTGLTVKQVNVRIAGVSLEQD